MPNRDVVILSAVRTPIGKYGGSFKDVHPAELGAVAARAAIHNAGIEPSEVDEVWIGHGRQAGSGPESNFLLPHQTTMVKRRSMRWHWRWQ